jgi:hypothetical protein
MDLNSKSQCFGRWHHFLAIVTCSSNKYIETYAQYVCTCIRHVVDLRGTFYLWGPPHLPHFFPPPPPFPPKSGLVLKRIKSTYRSHLSQFLAPTSWKFRIPTYRKNLYWNQYRYTVSNLHTMHMAKSSVFFSLKCQVKERDISR